MMPILKELHRMETYRMLCLACIFLLWANHIQTEQITNQIVKVAIKSSSTSKSTSKMTKTSTSTSSSTATKKKTSTSTSTRTRTSTSTSSSTRTRTSTSTSSSTRTRTRTSTSTPTRSRTSSTSTSTSTPTQAGTSSSSSSSTQASIAQTSTPIQVCPEGFVECGVTYYQSNVKIYNGTDALPKSWPAVVYVQGENEVGHVWMCTGTLIDLTTVLTAAHCVEKNDSTNYTITMGTNDIWNSDNIVMRGRQAIQNPQWDLAIIKLASPVKLSTFLQVACLPTTISTSYPALGSSTVILGWGTVKGGGSTHVLQIGDTNVVDSDLMYFSTFGSQYQCYGDSGGPSFQLSTIGEKLKYGSFDLDPVIHGQQRSAFRINT